MARGDRKDHMRPVQLPALLGPGLLGPVLLGRRGARLLQACSILCTLWPCLASAAPNRAALDREYRAYRTAIEGRAYDTAFVHASRALELGHALFGDEHETTAVLRINVGDVEMLRSHFAAARPHYELALAELTKLKGERHLALLIPLNDLARIHAQAGYFDRARAMHERALELVERTYGETHPAVANRLVTLGIFEELTDAPDAARARYRRSLEIRRALFPHPHPDVAESLFFLAKLELQQKHFAAAADLYEEALEIWKSAPPRGTKILTAARRQQDFVLHQLGRATERVAAAPVPRNAQAQPIFRQAPEYPQSALRRRLEGTVRLGFRLGTDGRVEDAHVIEADPPRIFDRAALSALRKWQYRPEIVDGRPVERDEMEVVLRFVLPK